MHAFLARGLALTLGTVVLASCNDTPTEPAVEESDASTPTLAVAANTWTSRADMPGTARGGLTTAVVTTRGQSVLYAIGGRTAEGSTSRVQAYDVATNTWRWRAPLPLPAYDMNGAGVINGKIYVSGGAYRDKSFRREVFMYDPARNTWTRKRDMPDDTWGGITGVINNQLYVLTCESEEECYIDGFGLTLYRYDPATDQWSFVGISPPQLRRPMGGVVSGKLYFTGVTREADLDWVGTLTEYNPATNQWTRKKGLARARYDGTAASVAAKLYVFGGRQINPDGTFVGSVRTTSVYDPATDSWTNKAQMPNMAIGVSANRVFLNWQPRIEVVGGPRPGNNWQYIP
ncbi:MAG TPA: kelch repeat-containing protein [Gemmatimonadales bacterium]|nr:kelch repeat-containing protein [Gemmatimonadales bacterium]